MIYYVCYYRFYNKLNNKLNYVLKLNSFFDRYRINFKTGKHANTTILFKMIINRVLITFIILLIISILFPVF